MGNAEFVLCLVHHGKKFFPLGLLHFYRGCLFYEVLGNPLEREGLLLMVSFGICLSMLPYSAFFILTKGLSLVFCFKGLGVASLGLLTLQRHLMCSGSLE